MTTTAPYVVAAALLFAIDDAWSAVAVGVGFGGGRLLMALARYLSPAGPDWDAALASRARTLLRAVSIVAVVAVTIVAWTA